MATLDLSGVTKSFGATPVLHGIDLAVADGEMIVVVGASGCGKYTLLRIVAGLESPSEGRVRIGGRDVTALSESERARRGLLRTYQHSSLFLGCSVLDNVALAVQRVQRVRRAIPAARDARARRPPRRCRASPGRWERSSPGLLAPGPLARDDLDDATGREQLGVADLDHPAARGTGGGQGDGVEGEGGR